NASLFGHIRECAVAVVVIQHIAFILGYEKIVKSVVIVIAPDTAHAIAGSWNAGCFRHVGECAVPVVAVQRVANGNAAAIKVTTVDKIDVLPAVAVEIGNTHAGTE